MTFIEVAAWSIGIFLIGYVCVIFLGARLVVPYLGFRKERIGRLPHSMKNAIIRLKSRSKNKKEYFRNTCKFLTKHFHGEKCRVWKELPLAFKDIRFMWKKKGFLPCNHYGHMLRVFLIKSGYFKEREVEICHMFTTFNIHQYVKVKLGKRWVDVDLWSHRYGVPVGKTSNYFY